MKTIRAKNFACSAMIFVIALKISTASAAVALSPRSTLSLALTNAGAVTLSISNSGDQVWIIQSSSNLASWSEVESLKIFNGNYNRSYTNTTNGNLFYRAFYDSTRQTIASTTTNALLLPAA